jgi:hypothetical protein
MFGSSSTSGFRHTLQVNFTVGCNLGQRLESGHTMDCSKGASMGHSKGSTGVIIQEIQDNEEPHKMAYGEYSIIGKMYTRKTLKSGAEVGKGKKAML